MNARDELVQIIDDRWHGYGYNPQGAADAILAAGYRKPRTITDRAEVEALPDGSVVADSAGDVSEKRGGLWCSYETAPMTDARLSKYLPATVLWEDES